MDTSIYLTVCGLPKVDESSQGAQILACLSSPTNTPQMLNHNSGRPAREQPILLPVAADGTLDESNLRGPARASKCEQGCTQQALPKAWQAAVCWEEQMLREPKSS